MAGKRKSPSAAVKAPVALAALQGDRTVNALARPFGVHPTLIHAWKQQLLAGAEAVFGNGAKAPAPDAQAEQAELFEQIGRLKMELQWLKKKSARSADELRPLSEVGHPPLSVRRQCALLGLSRSSLYYQPAGETADTLRLLRLIDEPDTACPFYGSRRLTAGLIRQGRSVNRKRVRRLRGLRGLEAIYPKPRLRGPGRGHRVYPSLLREVKVERPAQVWSADRTYVPLASGFMDRAATSDWYRRLVLAWRLSNTLDGSFCLEMLEEALSWGRPEVFNTDQGVPFTAGAWADRLERAGVAVRRAGRCRCLDNGFVERRGRSVKYEDI
jgi:putative transposase